MTRILVIDDDPTIRLAIAYTLVDEGYEVEKASGGQEALDLLDRQHFDLILLDMKMPRMDGWQFVKLYRGRNQNPAPIIVLTAAEDPGARAADVGADGYIPKPFDLDVLIERVSTLANRSGATETSA